MKRRRIVRLDDLTPEQRRLVLALVDAAKAENAERAAAVTFKDGKVSTSLGMDSGRYDVGTTGGQGTESVALTRNPRSRPKSDDEASE